MKTEDHAWRALNEHASAQLRNGFADRVLRCAHGPAAQTWQQLQAQAARQIRPGFAERVLRAARDFPANIPSLFDQFVLGAATVAVCLAAVVTIDFRSQRLEEERALASWQQLAQETEQPDQG
jgi:hypothetical protein